MLDPVCADHDDVSVSQLEGAMGMWTAETYVRSSATPGARRVSFDVPLPAKAVDARVAQRAEVGRMLHDVTKHRSAAHTASEAERRALREEIDRLNAQSTEREEILAKELEEERRIREGLAAREARGAVYDTPTAYREAEALQVGLPELISQARCTVEQRVQPLREENARLRKRLGGGVLLALQVRCMG